MSKPLSSIRQKMKPEVLGVAEKKAKKMLAAMPLFQQLEKSTPCNGKQNKSQ